MPSAIVSRCIQFSAVAALSVALGLTFWSGAERPAPQRAVSGVLAMSLQPAEGPATTDKAAEKEIPRRFRKNPAFQLFHKIDILVRNI